MRTGRGVCRGRSMSSFAEILYGLPAERLRQMAHLRQVDPRKLRRVSGKQQLAQVFAQELSRSESVAAAVTRCNVREVRLLQRIVACARGDRVEWPHLLAAVGGADLKPVLQPLVDRLETLGLVFRTDRGLFLAPGLGKHVPVSLSDRHTLSERLSLYDLAALKTIRDKLHIDAAADTRAALVEAICHHLLDQGPGLRLHVPLTPEEREVLEYVVLRGGALSAREAVNAVRERQDDFFRYDWAHRWKNGQERNAIDSLMARGILHAVAQDYGFNIFLIIPGDLLRVLTQEDERAFWQQPAPALQDLPEPPAPLEGHTGLCRDVVLFLGFLEGYEAVRTSTGHIHRTALKQATRLLSLPDERYVAFLYALCREAGLIAPQGDRQVYTLTPEGRQWLEAGPLDQIRLLFQAWREGIVWAEMENEPLIRAGRHRPADAVRAIRHAALDALVEAGEDRCYTVVSLTDVLTYRYPLLLARNALLDIDLVPSPAVFVRLLVRGCLFWLGVTRISCAPSPAESVAKPSGGAKSAAASRVPVEEEALAFQITPLGRYLLGLSGDCAPEMPSYEEGFIIQANAEIFVPPFLRPSILYRLLAFADPPHGSSATSVLTITRDAVRRALDRGATVREILAFLQSHSRTGIPQNVEYLINEVGSKHGHIHIGRAQMYLLVDSPLLLRELESCRELKPYFERSLSDTVALLRTNDPEKVLRDLRKAGYLPVLDDVPPASNSPEEKAPEEARSGRASAGTLQVDTAVNWDRMAQEDGKPYPAVSTGPWNQVPEGAVSLPTLIPFLLRQALQNGRYVEIAYRDAEGQGKVHRMELHEVHSTGVNGYSHTGGHPLSLSFADMLWVRLVPGAF